MNHHQFLKDNVTGTHAIWKMNPNFRDGKHTSVCALELSDWLTECVSWNPVVLGECPANTVTRYSDSHKDFSCLSSKIKGDSVLSIVLLELDTYTPWSVLSPCALCMRTSAFQPEWRQPCIWMASLTAQLVKIHLQCRRPRFNSWVRKIIWKRDRLPPPVFLGSLGGSDGK